MAKLTSDDINDIINIIYFCIKLHMRSHKVYNAILYRCAQAHTPSSKCKSSSSSTLHLACEVSMAQVKEKSSW